MGTYLKIHLANSLSALELLAKRNCDIDVKRMKFQHVCSALTKLYKESQLTVLDQEKTYILLYRYLRIYNLLKNTQPDKKFLQVRFGSELEKVELQLKETKRNLEIRYAIKEFAATKRNTPKQDESMITDDTPSQVFHDEFISCRQLISALEAKHNILLVDARPDNDFNDSRIDHPNSINVPDQCITPGLSANALGKKLPDETRKVWENRDTYDVIVLFDWSTSSDNFALTKLDKLRSSLVDWDLNRNYNERPVILNGGYLEILQTYPTYCINPHIYLSKKNNELDELLELDSITYPTESDNKSHVMGPPDEVPANNEIGAGDDQDSLAKELLIKENKEITLNRQGIIEQLLHEETEWKEINEKLTRETNRSKITALKREETKIVSEISRLEQVLEDLNSKKDDVKRRYESNFQYDPEDEIKIEDLKEINQIEADDSEKLKILDVIAEERCKALTTARALKPRRSPRLNPNNNSEQRETDRPVINRATKPSRSRGQVLKLKPVPLKHVTSGLIGMKNNKNTCYMLTVIHCIRNLPDIVRFFVGGLYTTYRIREPAAIIYETANLIRDLWSKDAFSINPIDFYEKIGALEANYKLGNHEDCMEFFLFLLNHLSEDCSYDINVPAIKTPKQKAWYNQFEGKNSIFIDLFYHQIRITQLCVNCKHKTYKFEIESTFMLPVPDNDKDFYVSKLMKEYMADYSIDDFCCAKCKKPVDNKKEICYEPRIMVIVLKRYRQEFFNGSLKFTKIATKAHFEADRFKVGKCYYKLYGIALHQGDVNYGHYTAAALTPKGWFEFNDEIVRPINIADPIVEERACAFFYSMCDD